MVEENEEKTNENGAAFMFRGKMRNPPAMGFNGLGRLVYKRTYSRRIEEGENSRYEDWHETVDRVVRGVTKIRRDHYRKNNIAFISDAEILKDEDEMFDRIYEMKFMPPGRGLWAMGSELTNSETRPVYSAVFNCGFITTRFPIVYTKTYEAAIESIAAVEQVIYDAQYSYRENYRPPSFPFAMLQDYSMLGVGVGFDTLATGLPVYQPYIAEDRKVLMKIEDSREGWVSSVAILLDSYLVPRRGTVEFDYSLIRGAGEHIKTFGGISAGPGPLKGVHAVLRSLLDKILKTKPAPELSIRDVVDIMNLIGKCVVSGNVRRTAEIAFGPFDNDQYLDLKNYSDPRYSDRAQYGWTSNNSVYGEIGMDYRDIAKRIAVNGEPGIAWLENMQTYSRMDGHRDFKDSNAAGGNPCLEQTLEAFELCCLVETFPTRHTSISEFLDTLYYALLYAKTVTLLGSHWPESYRVMMSFSFFLFFLKKILKKISF
jgi:hypothetical protein